MKSILGCLALLALPLSAAMLSPGDPTISGYLPPSYSYFSAIPQATLDAQFPQATTTGYQVLSFAGITVNLTWYELYPETVRQPVVATAAVPYIPATGPFVFDYAAFLQGTIPAKVPDVPEPGTRLLIAGGLLVLCGCRKRRRNAR